MSTHNIGFYEDLTQIIFELSSNIIKYAPYFFCCEYHYLPTFAAKQDKTDSVAQIILPLEVKFDDGLHCSCVIASFEAFFCC